MRPIDITFDWRSFMKRMALVIGSLLAVAICLSLCSCSAQKRLNRLLALHPELHIDTVVHLVDSVAIPAEKASKTFSLDVLKPLEPIVVETDKAKAELTLIDESHFELSAEQKPDTIVVQKTIKVPVYFTRTLTKTVVVKEMTNVQRVFFGIGIAFAVFIVLTLILWILKKIYLK